MFLSILRTFAGSAYSGEVVKCEGWTGGISARGFGLDLRARVLLEVKNASPALLSVDGFLLNSHFRVGSQRKQNDVPKHPFLRRMLTATVLTALMTGAGIAPAGAVPSPRDATESTAQNQGPIQRSATSASRGTKRPAIPMIIAEHAHLPNSTKTRVRLVLPSKQPNVVRYVVWNIPTSDTQKPKKLKTCSAAAMVNGSGSDGCYVDIGSNYTSRWAVRAYYKAGTGKPSRPAAFAIDALDDDDNSSFSEGTSSRIMVAANAKQAASLLSYVEHLGKNRAKDCAAEAAWDKGIDMLAKAAGKRAKKKPSVKTGAVALAGYSLKYLNQETTDNPCEAIAALVLDLARSTARAIKNKRYMSVIVAAFYETNGPDTCTVSTKATGHAAQTFVLRPDAVGGKNKGDCWAFWGPLVS